MLYQNGSCKSRNFIAKLVLNEPSGTEDGSAQPSSVMC